MKKDILKKLTDFIDAFETEYGDINGFKVILDRYDSDSDSDENFAVIKEFKIVKLVEETINLEE
jgi:hypothetical protein